MERVKYLPEQDERPDNVTEWRIVEKSKMGTTYVTNYGGSLLITKSGKHTIRQQKRYKPCPAMLALSIYSYYKRFTHKGKLSGKYVHRVIYQAFHPDEDITRKQIDHIDGNKYNNRVDNLRVCSGTKENCHFAAQIRRGEVIITNLQKSLFYVN